MDKGFMKTMEAFLAFFVTFIFVVFIVLKGVQPAPAKVQLEVLSGLELRDDFRQCVYVGNVSCVEGLVAPFIPNIYHYRVSIGAPTVIQGEKDIYTESIFIVSNTTNDFKTVYLYYWIIRG